MFANIADIAPSDFPYQIRLLRSQRPLYIKGGEELRLPRVSWLDIMLLAGQSNRSSGTLSGYRYDPSLLAGPDTQDVMYSDLVTFQEFADDGDRFLIHKKTVPVMNSRLSPVHLTHHLSRHPNTPKVLQLDDDHRQFVAFVMIDSDITALIRYSYALGRLYVVQVESMPNVIHLGEDFSLELRQANGHSYRETMRVISVASV